MDSNNASEDSLNATPKNTNASLVASNSQVAANAIVRLASDISSIYSIVKFS